MKCGFIKMMKKRNDEKHIGLCSIINLERSMNKIIRMCLDYYLVILYQKTRDMRAYRKIILLIFHVKDFLESFLHENSTDSIKHNIIVKHLKNVKTLIQILNDLRSKFDKIKGINGGYF